MEEFIRTEGIFGIDGMEKLRKSHIAIFGLGGVGSYVFEALVRSGIQYFDIIDNDRVSLSNINRQLIALHSTVGLPKTTVAKNRALDINPNCMINTYEIFFSSSSEELLDFSIYDYVVDCIDSIDGKIEIISRAKKYSVPVISSMGTGNKINPSAFEITDISKTSVCPLARVVRQKLRQLNISDVKVLFSKENPVKTLIEDNGKKIPASNSFVPASAGLLIASEVIKDIIKI